MDDKLHVACNVQPLCQANPAGIGRVMCELMERLARDGAIRLHAQAFIHDKEAEASIKSKLSFLDDTCFELRRGRAAAAYMLWGAFPPARELFFPKTDVYMSFNYIIPPGIREPKGVFFHDMVVYRFPETMDERERRSQNARLQKSYLRSDRVFAVSEFGRGEIIDCLGASPDKVTVILNAVDKTVFHTGYSGEIAAKAAGKYGIEDEYFFYVGTLEPRKNIGRLIDAYRLLLDKKKDAPKLVIGGGKGWKYGAIYEKLDSPELKSNVIFTGFVSDEDLPLLMRGARAFVFPSLYEGFGMPPLEAMACGCPVLCSNAASLPEIVADAGLSVDPYDVNALFEALYSLSCDDALCARLSRDGIERAKRFSWEKSAETLKDELFKLAGREICLR